MTLNDKAYMGPNNEVYIKKDTAVVSRVPSQNTDDAGSVPEAVEDEVTATEYGDGSFHRTVLELDSLVIPTADKASAGAGGSAAIYTFPKGAIQILGGIQKYDSMKVDGTAWDANVVVDVAVGSSATTASQETQDTDERDIIDKMDVSFGGATLKEDQDKYETAMAVIDGASTAVTAYLNANATAASAEPGTGSLTLSGKIEILWVNLGYAGE
jgi:hypothetical protein